VRRSIWVGAGLKTVARMDRPRNAANHEIATLVTKRGNSNEENGHGRHAPDFSPDGKRIVYASYLGQAWHQLWVMPAQGGNPFPLSYGDFDNVNPRWSPDGQKIAFISNRSGNTALWIQQVPVAHSSNSWSRTDVT